MGDDTPKRRRWYKNNKHPIYKLASFFWCIIIHNKIFYIETSNKKPMALFNIKSQSSSSILTPTWNTGNTRDSLVVKPTPKPEDYTSCNFAVSLSGGATILLNKCRFQTEAEHGSQPNKDLFVFL
jgi:hypothetical protein